MNEALGGLFSLRGLAMCLPGLILGVIVAEAVNSMWPKADVGYPIGGFVLMILTTSIDVTYRWYHTRPRGRLWFISPFVGGAFCFVPLWIIGGALIVAAPVGLALRLLNR